MSPVRRTVRLEGTHATMEIERIGPVAVVIRIEGTDVGELGHEPFRELELALEAGPVELFIDARGTRGASIDVSSGWALWLRKHRERLRQVTMLSGSRFVELTAEQVRRFAELGEAMHVTTDAVAFDAALDAARHRAP